MKNDKILVVPTWNDSIHNNAVWCANFQIAWNYFQYEILYNDFICENMTESIQNLISIGDIEDVLDNNDCYKFADFYTTDAIAQIKSDLQNKFNETSKIIDKLPLPNTFPDDIKTILLYTFLKKCFEYEHTFDELKSGTFGNGKEHIDYFGITSKSSESLRLQVRVLFYNSKNDYAIMITTKSKEEIILYRNDENKSFNKTFQNMLLKSINNKDRTFQEDDTLKIPNIKFNIQKSYDELKKSMFVRNADDTPFEISEAIQNIEFEMDRNGGRVKSEAAILISCTGLPFFKDTTKIRHFDFDDTFYLFMLEKGKKDPYLAMRIEEL